MKTSGKMGVVVTLGILTGLVLGWLARGWWWPEATPPATVASSGTRVVLPALRQPGEADHDATSDGGGKSRSLRRLIQQITTAESASELLSPFSPEQFDTFLARHQRGAGSLLTVYRITQDKALLREAYEKFPEDPRVAQEALGALDLSLEEELVMLEKVRQAHPDNPLADFLTSVALAKEGKTADTLRFLEVGLAKPGLDFGVKEQQLQAREAMMSIGLSSTEARVWGFMFNTSIVPDFIDIDKQARQEIQQRLQEGQEDEAFALAGRLLALGQRVDGSPDRSLFNEVVALRLKQGALAALPHDVEIGDTGQTAEQLLQASKAESRTMGAYIGSHNESVVWHLQHFDDAGVELYFQIAEERGERAALEWAEAYHGPAPTKER